MSVPSEQMIESTLLVLAWAKSEMQYDANTVRILDHTRDLVMGLYSDAPEET